MPLATRPPAARPAVAAALALVFVPGVLWGQIVTGSVTSEAGGAPVRGALVSLLDSAGTATSLRTLTDAAGTYALQLPAPGRYAVEVRAIGFVPRRGAPFTAGPGERSRSDVVLRVVTTRLASVQVRGRGACRLSSELDPVTTDVWDAVWTALASSEVALEQRLVPADVFMYSRQVDAATGVVVYEDRRVASVVAERPFRNASPEDLAKYGYRRVGIDGGMLLYAPDPQTLISPEFLATHCFALGADSAQDGQVSLEFQPARSRTPSDVRGTLRVDPESRELRSLEFSYTGIPAVKGYRAEGQMRFIRLANGIWVDDQWRLRYPAQVVDRPGLSHGSVLRIVSSGGTVRRGSGVTMLEAGGFVLSDSARRRRFGLTGGYVFQPGDGLQSLADVEVEVLGTPLRLHADSGGAWNIFDILPGTYDIRTVRFGRGETGAFIADRTVTFAPGQGVRHDMNVPADTAVARALCPRRRPDGTTSVVTGVVRDAESGWPLANQPMDLELSESYVIGGARPIVRQRTQSRRVTTDWRGEFVWCDAPRDSFARLRVAQQRNAPWTQPEQVGAALTVIEVVVDAAAPGGR